jgi:prepilin signal peptidase PulO-like enzyme (type II secretory pathway)
MIQILSQILLTLVLLSASLWISLTDFRERRIPDLASLPLIGVGLIFAGSATHVGLADRLIGMGAGFLMFWAIGEVYFRLRGHEALGLGDAKLYAAAGAWLGWAFLPEVLLLATLMGLAFAMLHAPSRKDGLAFGPWLVGGFILSWFHLLIIT